MQILKLILSTAWALSAPNITKTSVAGNGCYGDDRQVLLVSETEARYSLPIRVKLAKKAGSSFDRKTCNMRLPISLKANEKLQISDVSQPVQINGLHVKSTLNISVAGKKSKPLVATVSGLVKFDGLLVESDCGRDTIVTGNLSVLAQGAEPATAATEAVQLVLKIVKCETP